MPIVKITIMFAVLNLLSTEVFSCSCSRAWRNSFLSNVGRFDVVAMGTIGRTNSDDGFGKPYLNITKLYKGKVNDSIIQLIDGGFDCRHMWIADSGVQIIVGLFTDNYKNHQNEELYYGAGCITSVLVLSENDRLITNSEHIDYAGQAREPRVSWLFSKMKFRRFERRINLKTLFHQPEIRKKR
jgi:hypothetical protein